jgi:hypothetical protein
MFGWIREVRAPVGHESFNAFINLGELFPRYISSGLLFFQTTNKPIEQLTEFPICAGLKTFSNRVL